MGKIKWTDKMREMVYTTLVKECGPYSNWETVAYPKKKQRKEYIALLERLAEGLTKITGIKFSRGAVQDQIAWAITTQKQIAKKGQMRTHYINVAAALNTGFMTYNDLPSSLVLKVEEE